MTLLHQIVLFLTESFSLFDPVLLILRIAGSFLLTIFLFDTFERMQYGKIKT
jgi:hypothetical protein